jgi:hypothetical protein
MDEVSNKCSYDDMHLREFNGGTLRSVTKENFPY